MPKGFWHPWFRLQTIFARRCVCVFAVPVTSCVGSGQDSRMTAEGAQVCEEGGAGAGAEAQPTY